MGRFSPLLVAVAATTLALVAGAAARPGDTRVLRVSVTGGGVVSTTDGRIRCAPRCSASYRRGAVRKLTAAPSRFYLFVRWERDCIGTAPICVVALDRRTTVRAVFVGQQTAVSVSSGGPGTVVSTPAGIRCGGGSGDCDITVPHGTTVTLSPVPAADGRFHSWDGPCAGGPADCTLRVEVPGVQAAAAFEHVSPGSGPQTLTVARVGENYVRVTSQPPGIDCPPTCSTSFPSQTFAILTAPTGVIWSGACSGRHIHCSLVVDAPTEVVAMGPPPPPPAPPPRPRAQVDVTVSGQGLVASRDRRIECGRRVLECSALFSGPHMAMLTLRASPGRHFRLAGWYGGACRGMTPICRVRSRTEWPPAKNNVAALFRVLR